MKHRPIRLIMGAVLIGLAALVTGCGNSRDEAAHRAIPTFYVHNYIERQIFNHRLEIADDPSAVLFCTAFPFDAEPYTVPIAGKLVSGQKRPDTPNRYNGNGGQTGENVDSQGMYGPSEPYRFGFTPGGVYIDFTNIPTVCQTQAVSFKKTSIGLVQVTNPALTAAGREAEAVLKAGLSRNATGQFQGYTPESKKKAQEILDNATNTNSTGTVSSTGKGAH